MKQISIFILTLCLSVNLQAQNWAIIPSGSTDDLTSCSYGSPSHVYITGSQTIIKSTNGGLSFSPLSVAFLPANSSINSCFFTSQDTGFVVLEDMNGLGFIYKTTNGGNAWTSVLSSTPFPINNITFPSSQIGYAISDENIYKTTDGGNTWTSIYSSSPNSGFHSNLHFRNNNDGYVVGLTITMTGLEAKTVKVTGGSTTNVTSYPAYFLFSDVHFLNVDTGFIVALDFGTAYILRTTNGGATWTNVYSNLNEVSALTFTTSLKGYAVGTSGTILKTTNSGTNWVNSPSPTIQDLIAITHLDSANMIAVGALGTIIKTTVCTGVPTSGTLVIPPSCSPVTINGISYNSSGNYTQILANSNGCDSTLNITVTINTPSATSLNVNTCSPYTLNGITYSMSGTYTQNYTNANGCDSIVTLNLIIGNINASISQASSILTASPSGATYQWLNCPSFTPITGATNQSYTVISNGSYAVKVTQAGCIDTSTCIAVNGVGLNDYLNNEGLEILPNPNNGSFTLKSTIELNDIELVLYSMTGQIVLEQKHKNGSQFNFNISSQSNGIYFLHINSTNSKVGYKPIKVYKN